MVDKQRHSLANCQPRRREKKNRNLAYLHSAGCRTQWVANAPFTGTLSGPSTSYQNETNSGAVYSRVLLLEAATTLCRGRCDSAGDDARRATLGGGGAVDSRWPPSLLPSPRRCPCPAHSAPSGHVSPGRREVLNIAAHGRVARCVKLLTRALSLSRHAWLQRLLEMSRRQT